MLKQTVERSYTIIILYIELMKQKPRGAKWIIINK